MNPFGLFKRKGNLMKQTEPRITQLLQSAAKGDEAAANLAWEAVYRELQNIATGYLKREYQHQTLQASDLVHEVYLRMFGQNKVRVNDRKHFYRLAARQMRHFLVDRTRKKRALKREGENISLDDCLVIGQALDERLLALDSLLTELNALDAEAAAVVEMRYFGGYSAARTAELLDISAADERDHFEFAKAWLKERMVDK